MEGGKFPQVYDGDIIIVMVAEFSHYKFMMEASFYPIVSHFLMMETHILIV